MVQYVAVKKELSERPLFGIAAVDGGTEIDCIEDVLPSWGDVLALAEQLQAHAVPEEHFRDIVQDYIVDAV